MSFTSSTIAQPAARSGANIVSRALSACFALVAGYFLRRAAIASLRDLDDRALRDIGIARSQIEAAVHGTVNLERGRM
jgi:uncharacterized protein YjiS (DUF1127 family)